MIHLQDVRFRYPDGPFELGVSELATKEGQRVCWKGPSGSGKTTLLNLVAGIHVPEAGQVRTCGVDLGSLSNSARRDFRISNIGLVFQDFALLDYLSLLENILLPYRISGAIRLDRTVVVRAERLAKSIGLGKLLNRRPIKLSQGERQRIAVCRAIIAQPKLILADEPTANLDSVNANLVLNAFDEYVDATGATLVVVSHDQSLFSRFDETVDVSNFCERTTEAASEDRV